MARRPSSGVERQDAVCAKTFTTYQLALEMHPSRVLVLTYKPAVQTQWRGTTC